MRRTFALEELDCANCAQRMEDAINKLDGVQSASVSFLSQRLMIEADESDFEDVLARAQKAIKRIEPDCRIVR